MQELPFFERKKEQAKKVVRILVLELRTHADFTVAIIAGPVVKMVAIIL